MARGGASRDRRRARRAKQQPVTPTEPLVASAAEAQPSSDDRIRELALRALGDPNHIGEAAVTAAGEPAVWGPEDGVMDLMYDLFESLNPDLVSDDGWDCWDCVRYYVLDVAVEMDRALVCDWSDDSYYVVGFTIDDEGEPIPADREDWMPVEQAWVADTAAVNAQRAAQFLGRAFVAGAEAAFTESYAALVERAVSLLPGPVTPGVTAAAVEEVVEVAEPIESGAATVQPSAVIPAADQSDGLVHWTAVLIPEGVVTEDGRMFAPGSVTWRDTPLSLMAMIETQPGHDGATLAGRIDRIWREGNLVMGEGIFDTGDYGTEIARLVDDRTLRGLSVDTAILSFEVRDRADLEAGKSVEEAAEVDALDVLAGDANPVFVITEGVIGMATVCPFPAFADAEIAVVASGTVWQYRGPLQIKLVRVGGENLTASAQTMPATGVPLTGIEVPADGTVAELPAALTAAAAGLVPVHPPAEWFSNPALTEPTPLVVTAEGHVYGHAALWDTCHIGLPGLCQTAPHSNVGYSFFHLGEVECDGGERVACGKITLGTNHPSLKLGWKAAASHYDDTGTAVVDVIAGEDDFGIWIAGALRPDVDAAKVRELRAAVLSGDWRNINNNLELVAVLACNVPGFPVPRRQASIVASAAAEGSEFVPEALVAAGISRLTAEQRDRIDELAAAALPAAEPEDTPEAEAAEEPSEAS